MRAEQPRTQRRQQRILDAALRVFSRRGYHDALVDEIADESETSKGGVYFHFPGKRSLFLALLDRTVARLREKIEEAIASEPDPIAKADAALLTFLRTFAKHRPLARLFMVEALGAGREFHRRVLEIHDEFTGIIKYHLDDAIAQGVIAPIDTDAASRAWFGALNEIITHWVLSHQPAPLEDTYAALRPLLMRSVGVNEDPYRQRDRQ
jgi:AcrR family transcriptional regulator